MNCLSKSLITTNLEKLPTDLSELTVKDVIEIAKLLKKSPVEVFEAILNELEASETLTSKELFE